MNKDKFVKINCTKIDDICRALDSLNEQELLIVDANWYRIINKFRKQK